MPLYEVLGLGSDDKLFREVNLSVDQILLLRQSWAEGDTNEITADAFLNWVFYRNSSEALGFTDTGEWHNFMDVWIWQSIVQNVMRTGDSTYISEIDGFPDVFGSGTVLAALGLNVRSAPMVKDGNVIMQLRKDENLLILGLSEDGKWIATAKRGVLAWVSYGPENDRNVSLPEGLSLKPYKGDKTLNLDPFSDGGDK